MENHFSKYPPVTAFNKMNLSSSPVAASNEHEIINSCFDEGLEILHIHKPLYSKKR